MITLVYGADALVADWAGQRLGMEFKDFTAIGIAEEGKLIAGVVYHGYRDENIEMNIVAETPRWISKGRLHALFFYPFGQLQCQRVTAITARKNKRTRKMLLGLGFALEGVMRCALPQRRDAMIYGLLNNECKWIN